MRWVVVAVVKGIVSGPMTAPLAWVRTLVLAFKGYQ